MDILYKDSELAHFEITVKKYRVARPGSYEPYVFMLIHNPSDRFVLGSNIKKDALVSSLGVDYLTSNKHIRDNWSQYSVSMIQMCASNWDTIMLEYRLYHEFKDNGRFINKNGFRLRAKPILI